MKRVLNLFLAVLLVCTVNGLGDLKAQSNNKVAQLEKLSAIEKKPQKTIRKRTAAIRHSLKTAASAESVKLFGCLRHGRLDARHTADTQSLVRQLSYQPRLR